MKVAVISDIHGNWEALTTVEKAIEKCGVDEIWCLGDIVGYGPDPSRCIEWVREKCSIVIAGNHDWAVTGKESIEYFNPWAKEAVLKIRNMLSAEEIDYLNNLPLTYKKDNILLVHGSPLKPQEWFYIFDEWDAKAAFEATEEWIIFVGHSHIPGCFSYKGNEIKEHCFPLKLKDTERYIINPGSVGQPRDGDPRASFGILDLKDMIFEICRVNYDIKTTQEKIKKADLPVWLATRLEKGL